MAMDKVNTSLAAVQAKDRTAWFICVLALVWPDGEEAVFEGRIDGTSSGHPAVTRVWL